VPCLAYFHSASIALQSRDTNQQNVRCIFDRLLKKFGNEEELHHLRDDDKIVHYEIHSKELVKLQSGKAHLLTEQEKIEMEPYLVRDDDNGDDDDDTDDDDDDDEDANGWAQRTISKTKKQKTITSEYIPTRWIPCGTCEVERLFSTCKNIYSAKRQNMTPETMEILLYLRINRKYWNINVVQQVVNNVVNMDVEVDLDNIN